jgi:hypothetical protein
MSDSGSDIGPSSNGGAPNTGSEPPPRRTRSAPPHRSNDQEGKTTPSLEHSGVEPQTVPARRRRAPAATGVSSVPAPANDGPNRPEWCSIVFAPLPHGGEFQVLAVQEGGRREVVARSQPFRIPVWCRIVPLRRLPNLGPPRRAHDELVTRFVAAGWQQMPTRGRWYDTALVRTRSRP